MKLSLLFFTCLATALPFAAGCAASGSGDEGVSEAQANSARVAVGTFKLYNEPNARPNPSCDVHTRMELKADAASIAHLEEGLEGSCEIFVLPNARDYVLREQGSQCGSRIFAGETNGASGRRKITITDHRTRLCEDVVPAALVVEETLETEIGEITVTKFSHDRTAPAAKQSVEGTLVGVAGIGGESTGFGIMGVDHCGTDAACPGEGFFELILDGEERGQFADGRKARVTGTLTFLSGVETKDRRALDVEQMVVCPDPGFVDCMPGDRRSPLCAHDNRQWASENCDGVQFVD